MTLQLLISTMHQVDFTLLDKMRVASDAVVINQCDRESRETIEYNGHSVLWINTTERGLSKSRNMAIRNANADICMIADDDMEYRDGYVDTVISAFSRIDADIIGFQVCGIEQKFKDYSPEEQRINYLKSLRMASVEIAFKRASFIEKNIRFDELIGAGTEFMIGEENAMLFQSLQKGLKIFYTPKVISDLHMVSSTWRCGINERYFMGKGAAFTAMRTPFTMLLIWQWAIRKRSFHKHKVFTAVAYMKKGKKMYLEKSRKAEQ